MKEAIVFTPAPSSIQIRPLEGRHAQAVRHVATPSFERLWSAGEFSYFLTSSASRCLGAFSAEGSLIGYVLALVAVDEMDVISVAVDPRWRRIGIARRLIEEALGAREIHKAFLEVAVENEAAVALYRGLGFQTIGLRKKYYDGRRDALLMSLNLRLC